MSLVLVAATFFGGNIEASRSFLDEYGYIQKAISKSLFNRRLHAIDTSLWQHPMHGGSLSKEVVRNYTRALREEEVDFEGKIFGRMIPG